MDIGYQQLVISKPPPFIYQDDQDRFPRVKTACYSKESFKFNKALNEW